MRHGKFDHENLSEDIQPKMDGGEDWRSESACKTSDPDIFFPEDIVSDEQRQEVTAQAKAKCGGCNVRLMCLDFALRNDERTGIFGGLDSEERKSLVADYTPVRDIREAISA